LSRLRFHPAGAWAAAAALALVALVAGPPAGEADPPPSAAHRLDAPVVPQSEAPVSGVPNVPQSVAPAPAVPFLPQSVASVFPVPIAPQSVAPALDVPFVPQSEALCGGAAVAMVLRYWGVRGVAAENFSHLVEETDGGIRVDSLIAEVERRGARAWAFAGDSASVSAHLAAGRPVIALIEDRPGRFHYVVLTGWAQGGLLLHDPARGPFRRMAERSFQRRWEASGRLAVLVLPHEPEATDAAEEPGEPGAAGAPAQSSASAPETAPPPADPLGPGASGPRASPLSPPLSLASLVADGVRLGRAGDTRAAEARLDAAVTHWPDSAAGWREISGLRFRQERWREAAAAAERAVRCDPADSAAWSLLGASRFLDERPEAALAAWNAVGTPRLDQSRIEGLRRTRYPIVARRLGLRPGQLLTPGDFRRARRRLEAIPAIGSSRFGLRPLSGGLAEVDAAVVERPLLPGSPLEAGALAARAIVRREAVLTVLGPTGGGELWRASWRWEDRRPRWGLEVRAPGLFGLGGVFEAEGFREVQTYDAERAGGILPETRAGGAVSPGDAAARPAPAAIGSGAREIREARRGARIGWSDWVVADLRLAAQVAFERWEVPRGRFAAAGLGVEARPFGESLRLTAEAARWAAISRGRSFSRTALGATWSGPLGSWRDAGISVRAAFERASANAPRAAWPGAGTGSGRDGLLRAHPLLRDGVVRGDAFAPALWTGGAEVDWRRWRFGPIRGGPALFLDAARGAGWTARGQEALPGGSRRGRLLLDLGTGLRLGLLPGTAGGLPGEIAIDAATGLVDGASAISVRWVAGGGQPFWP